MAYKREYINKIADIMRKNFELSCPYDPSLVVGALGGKIEYNSAYLLDQDASIKRKGNSFKIILNVSKSNVRERFTLAHELGHLFLHMGLLVDEREWEKGEDFQDSIYYRGDKNYSTEEKEADEFAAAFLMPTEEFETQIYQNLNGRMIDISKIASYFNVSTTATQNRAKWLGYINW